MKKAATTFTCIVLCCVVLSGCGLLSKTVSVLRDSIRGKTAEPMDTALFVETATPDDLETEAPPEETAAGPETAAPEETTAPEETLAETDTPQPQSTALSGDRESISKDEIMAFFQQVVFGANPESARVQKWKDKIVVAVTGSHNKQDDEQLTNIFDTLNDYEGFPGIVYQSAAGKSAKANFKIKFVSETTLKAEEPDWSGDNSCYATYKYNDQDEIDNVVIYLVSDWEKEQAARNYLLTWAVFYSIGLVNDSTMYYDSVFNANYYDEQLGSTFGNPVAADWYLVSMLYSKTIKPGMTMEQAVDALTSQ